jgi:hypothetical protein
LLAVDARGMICLNVDHVGRPQTAPMAVNHALDLSDASDRFTWSPHWRRHGHPYRSALREIVHEGVTLGDDNRFGG